MVLSRYESDEERWKALMIKAQGGDESAYRQLLHELATVTRAFLIARFGFLS